MLRSFCFRAQKVRCLRLFGTESNLATFKDLHPILHDHVFAVAKSRTLSESELNSLAAYSPSASRCKAILPLSTCGQLREKYVNFLGNVRFGMLLEDLDTFAVLLAYQHNQSGPLTAPPRHHPMAIVTACVDRIVLELNTLRIPIERDIIFDGEITWVGRSSMEATIRLSQQPASKTDDVRSWPRLMEAKFVMVAKDPKSDKPIAVHPLKPETEEEIENFKIGEAHQKCRHVNTQQSLLKSPPSAAESALLHELFVRTLNPKSHSFRDRVLPPDHAWMEDCKLKNVIICFPQQRNLYNKIFGGFLMRSAFELAFANASAFCYTNPVVMAVDDIMFRKPVDIGCLLYLSSEVCYTKKEQMQVRVHAEVVNLEKRTQETTNTFHFTFLSGDAQPVRKVLPKSYADGMLYVSAKRHFDDAANKPQSAE